MEYQVKDLMVPISEYATVPEGVTLFEAVTALEEAQNNFDHSLYHHRAVLVMDKNNRVKGKLSQLNVLRALEPRNGDDEKISDLSKYGFSSQFLAQLNEKRRMEGMTLKELCYGPANEPVEKFMQAPDDCEYIQEEASLASAILQIAVGPALSLLVCRGKEIVGVLRLGDVFGAVFHMMKIGDFQKNKEGGGREGS